MSGSAEFDSYLKKFEGPFKKLDVSKIPLSDLRKFENVSSPMMRMTPPLLPTPFKKNESTKIQLWAHSCAPCLAKLENKWQEPNQIWINIDTHPYEIGKSLNFLERKKILITAYHDYSANIEQQTGGTYPRPVELEIEKLKVKKIRLGASVLNGETF